MSGTLLQEYRVIWKREGLAPKHRLYQTMRGAQGCAHAQRSAIKEFSRFAGDYNTPPPPLEWVRIESRDVGEWQA